MGFHPVYNRIMLPPFHSRIRTLAIVALVVMLAVSACQAEPPPGDAQPTTQPTVGVTVLVPTPLATQAIQPLPTSQIETEAPTVAPEINVETPAFTGQLVGIATASSPEQALTPTAGGQLIRRSVPAPKPRTASMKITSPGPYSKVSSPVKLNALISPGEDRRLYLNMYGEDGRVMDSQILDFGTYDSLRFNIMAEIPFTINSAAELARIEIYVIDQYGLKIQLASVELILIQYGDSEITPNEIEFDPFTISIPGEGTVVSGGVLVAEGIARTVTDGPLIVDLVDEKGVVVGSGETQVSPPSERNSHMPFQAIVPYSVQHRTRARLTVRQESTGRIPGTVWLLSQVVFLDP